MVTFLKFGTKLINVDAIEGVDLAYLTDHGVLDTAPRVLISASGTEFELSGPHAEAARAFFENRNLGVASPVPYGNRIVDLTPAAPEQGGTDAQEA